MQSVKGIKAETGFLSGRVDRGDYIRLDVLTTVVASEVVGWRDCFVSDGRKRKNPLTGDSPGSLVAMML